MDYILNHKENHQNKTWFNQRLLLTVENLAHLCYKAAFCIGLFCLPYLTLFAETHERFPFQVTKAENQRNGYKESSQSEVTLTGNIQTPALKTVSSEKELPFILPSQEQLERITLAEIKTTKGSLFLKLFPDVAPTHVANFKYLADQKMLHDIPVRYLPDHFAVSARTKTSLQYSLLPEFSSKQFRRGSLGMSRLNDTINAERLSSSYSFFILTRNNSMVRGSYTIFGQLIRGWTSLDSLTNGDRILSTTVFVDVKTHHP